MPRKTTKPRNPRKDDLLKLGRARIEDAAKTLQKDLKRFQKQAETSRRKFEKRVESELRKLRQEARKNPLVKRARELQAELEKGPVAKRLARARKDTSRAAREGLDNVFANLQIASASDVDKLERKVAKLTRKLSELENTARR